MLIALSGHAGAGKDCVGAMLGMLAEIEGLAFTRRAFAESLKTKARYAGWNGEKNDFGRWLLQTYGTLMRQQDPGYWIRNIVIPNPYEVAGDLDSLVVITDLRYRNEAEWVRECGGQIWRVERKNYEMLSGKAASHASETELDSGVSFDWCVRAESGDFETMLIDTEAGLSAYKTDIRRRSV